MDTTVVFSAIAIMAFLLVMVLAGTGRPRHDDPDNRDDRSDQ